jgi:acyl-CoA reductase-like NAD-dependent aldehyde dehydrogenase
MTIQDFKMFIDGEWVASSSNKKIETFNPENNEVWATVPEANEEDVDKAVKSCSKELSKKLGEIYTQLREENI